MEGMQAATAIEPIEPWFRDPSDLMDERIAGSVG